MITDPFFFVVAVAAVIAVGLSKGGYSGLGTISVPLMALAVPPIQAIAILIPILLTQDVVTLWAYRKKWDAGILKVMIPGQVIGVCIAWAMAAYVSDAIIRLIIGVIAVLFVLNHWLGLAQRAAAQKSGAVGGGEIARGLAFGAAAGFSSFLANSGSPPFQIHVLPKKLDKETFVGTFSVFIAAGNAMKVLPYFMLGQLTTENMTTAAVLLPLAVASNLAGVWLVRRTPTEFFFRLIYVLIFLVGCELIRNGVTALWFG